jgi:virginiamycin B lyase
MLGFIWVLVVIMIAGWQGSMRAADSRVHAQNGSPGSSYVYLFDKTSSTFVFTFTHPELDAGLWDVEILGDSDPTEIWFTERGLDRLGKLVYTDTQDYDYEAYDVPGGSDPLNMVLDGGYVWFTAPGRNVIGRLDRTTGVTAVFPIPTSASFPADLDMGDDGSIWFTERDAGQIAQLVVTSTQDYHIQEYQRPFMEDGQPYGIDVFEGEDRTAVFFAQPSDSLIARFTPQEQVSPWVYIPGQRAEQPFDIVADSYVEAWTTDRSGNSIDLFSYGTFPTDLAFDVQPTNSDPHSLVLDSGGNLWFTQRGAAQLGRLGTGKPHTDRDYFDLPMYNLLPTGLAEDGTDLWVLATHPYQVFLSIVLKNH